RRPDAAARRLRRAAPLGGPRPRGHRIARRLQPEGTAVTADPLDAALDRIAAAPDGPGVAAMFDFDGTIIHGYSGVHFFRDRLAAGKVGPRELVGTAVNGLRGTDSEAEFERFVAVAFRAWAGHTEDEMREVGRNLFENTLAGLIYPEAWRLIEA